MFERFTPDSRFAVVRSQDYARMAHSPYITAAHSVLGVSDCLPAEVGAWLAAHGTTLAAFSAAVLADTASLPVPEGQIPFSPGAKEALTEAFQHSLALQREDIRPDSLFAGATTAPLALAELSKFANVGNGATRAVPTPGASPPAASVKPPSFRGPLQAAVALFDLGARRSALADLELLWQGEPRDHRVGAALARALLVVGRFDEAVEVTIESLRTASPEWAAKAVDNCPALLLHPTPGYAMGLVKRDRTAAKLFAERELDGLVAMTGPQVTARALEIWWRTGASRSLGSLSGTRWAAISLAAVRADDADRAVAAERRAALADPAAPLLRIARAEVGLPAPSLDPAFDDDALAVYREIGDVEPRWDDPSDVGTRLAAHPNNPLLQLGQLAHSEAWLAGDLKPSIDVVYEIVARPNLGVRLRKHVLNHLAWVRAVEAACDDRQPHSDAVAAASLIAPSPTPAGLPWQLRDTAGLVYATDRQFEIAQGLLAANDVESAEPRARASVAVTRAYLAFYRRELVECAESLRTALALSKGHPAWIEPHTRRLARKLGIVIE